MSRVRNFGPGKLDGCSNFLFESVKLAFPDHATFVDRVSISLHDYISTAVIVLLVSFLSQCKVYSRSATFASSFAIPPTIEGE